MSHLYGASRSALRYSLIAGLAAFSLGLAPAQAAVQLPAARQMHLAKGMESCAHWAQVASVARAWNETLLAAIRLDAPRPTVHARNLYHTSVAIYDAWSAFDPVSRPVLADESAATKGLDLSARGEVISYAAYRLLRHRFAMAAGSATTLPRLDACLQDLGFDPAQTSTAGNAPSAIGNRIAEIIIQHGMSDLSNEAGNYADTTGYIAVNSPMLVALPGTGGLLDINRWQPLIPPGAPGVQSFLTPHWRMVTPFAITRPGPGAPYANLPPPLALGGAGDAQLKADVVQLIRFSANLDPDDGALINISPNHVGNSTLGSNDGQGYPANPVTGVPYPDNIVKRGDWGRVLAEFWADGPRSTTPPGHWNEIANEVSDHPSFVPRMRGTGPVLDRLEWDAKLYLALNGAVHDSAIATWEAKLLGESARPITLIRGMAEFGQSSDPGSPAYHPLGLPLEPGLIELVTAQSSAPGQRHEQLAGHVGEVAILAWAGHPADPATQHGGVAWQLGIEWIPYQQRNFVTPPFPGYTSGHSGFSRASAEVLTALTGSPWFPDGMGEFIADAGGGFSLGFEFGPSEPVHLQWASYYDAADEAGVSRIHGGIHPRFDDLPARVAARGVAEQVLQRAFLLFGNGQEAVPVPALAPLPLMLLAGLIAMLGGGLLVGRRHASQHRGEGT